MNANIKTNADTTAMLIDCSKGLITLSEEIQAFVGEPVTVTINSPAPCVFGEDKASVTITRSNGNSLRVPDGSYVAKDKSEGFLFRFLRRVG